MIFCKKNPVFREEYGWLLKTLRHFYKFSLYHSAELFCFFKGKSKKSVHIQSGVNIVRVPFRAVLPRQFEREVSLKPCGVQALGDVFPVGKSVERHHMRIVEPGDFVARNFHIVVQVRAEELSRIFRYKVAAFVVTHFMPGIDAKSHGRVSV